MGNQILYFVKDFFSSAGLIVGIFALVGSILLRRTPLKTAVSTVTTVLGFFILSAGGAAIGASLLHFTEIFKGLVNAQGSAVIAASDTWAISVLNAQSNVASTASIMLLLVIFFNLLLAKTSSFKNIYLSTHIEMYLCIAFATLFQITGVKIGIDHYQAYIAILCGAGLIAIYATLAPSLTTHSAYLLMNERNINLCHHGLFAFGLSNAIGTLIGKMKKGRYTSCEKINMPRWMSFLKDSNISLVLVMVLIFLVIYIAGWIKMGTDGFIKVTNIGDQTSIPILIITDALAFTAGVLVLIMGIGMMVNELKVCIEGISKRLIQGATMSVDASLALKYRPTAVLIGFLVSFLGGLLFMAITIALNHAAPGTFHVIVLPSLLVMFFLGGIVGVFADIKGGIIATVVASFIIGILVSLIPFFLSLTWYGMTDNVGLTSTLFSWNVKTFNTWSTNILNLSLGESDYIMVPIFGWIMFAGAKISTLGGINVGTLVLLAIVIAAYTALILFGQIKNKNNFIVSPDQYLHHHLQDVTDARAAYKARMESDNEYFTRKYANKNKELLDPRLTRIKNKFQLKDKILTDKEQKINKEYAVRIENIREYATQLTQKTPKQIELLNKNYQTKISQIKAESSNDNEWCQTRLEELKLNFDAKNNYLTTLQTNATKLANSKTSEMGK